MRLEGKSEGGGWREGERAKEIVMRVEGRRNEELVSNTDKRFLLFPELSWSDITHLT